MTKILLLGYSPPQLAGETKIEAAHYRTWQFLEPLLDDGHTVCLCTDGVGDDAQTTGYFNRWPGRLLHRRIPYGQRAWTKFLQEEHDMFEPECVVAVNFSHCLYATKLRTPAPIWMDIYGDMLTIMQAAFYRAQSNRGLDTSIAFMRQVLRKGDIFSVCGLPQKHALVGELAMAGRLNCHTFGYEFAHVVLPGVRPELNRETKLGNRPFLAQWGINPEDFVVLWCGGYNTWTDVDTLFAGLERAMSCNKQVHYVSVGANTYNAPDNVYTRLLDMIRLSPFAKHFHMLGWRPWPEMSNFYTESDIGINIDALHYETLYGTRTRLVEMIGAGLPVITSLGSELSHLLQEHDAARTFEIGDWEEFGNLIVQLADHPQLRQEVIDNARRYAEESLSFYNSLSPVRAWARQPDLAPDRAHTNFRVRLQELEYKARAQARLALWRLMGRDR